MANQSKTAYKSYLLIPLLCLMILGKLTTDVESQAYFCGTTIVAIRTPQELLVGADSKMTLMGDKPSNASVVCKIGQVDSLFFAYAGLTRDSLGAFSVPATVSRARKRGDSMLATVNNFETMIADPLKKILERVNDEQPASLQKHLMPTPVSIAFFGVEKGIPLLYVRYFHAIVSADGSVFIETEKLDCPGDCPTGMTYAFLGEKDAIIKFLNSHPHYSRSGWVRTINKLIEVEAADKPEYVGLPVDILRIDKNGAKWIQRNVQCPEVRKY